VPVGPKLRAVDQETAAVVPFLGALDFPNWDPAQVCGTFNFFASRSILYHKRRRFRYDTSGKEFFECLHVWTAGGGLSKQMAVRHSIYRVEYWFDLFFFSW